MITMILFFTSFFLSIAIGVPIFLCLGVGALILVWLATGQIPFEIIGQKMLIGVDSFPLMAIPFFILAGELMNTNSISGKLIEFVKAIIGRVRGGLAMVGVGTSIFFSGISGSASADTAAVGSALIPAMKKDGYPTAFSAGMIAAAGSIGPIIPPSIPLIIYGVIAEVSIEKLFVGGYVPGVMMGIFFFLYIYYVAKKNNFPVGAKISIQQFFRIVGQALPTLLLPVIIMGGIVTGVFTATEAAGVAAGYAFLLSVVIYREVRWKDVLPLFGRAALTSSVILVIISASSLLSWIMTREQIPQTISNYILSLSTNPVIVLVLINIVLLVAGMFLDAVSVLMILTPIFLPAILALGIDPVLFGVMIAVNLSIGVLTPPVGLNLFVASSIANIDVLSVSKATIPFILCIIAVLVIMICFPISITYLPSLLD
ncbi:TRAP transporter large permease [Ammoniphilus resinae]|uniref:C4-dicarboxylate transporter DctM subunit n=1 Tax=Ammoniphilus resinae TaxID=861532 RepID=A0ABS4GYP5_9BACL|nr:TRAP transporter large permease [Ammoniphilus resinae]MBP1935005.1 C4-dicarboxylate transporter DctM subunit [Ammoniphilus resinae]